MLLQNINTVWGWVLFSGSIAPVYATVYKTVLFTKAVLFHREWARETPLQRRYSADAPGWLSLLLPTKSHSRWPR